MSSKTSNKLLALTSIILKKIEGGDEVKIDGFLNKIIASQEAEIKGLNMNLQVVEFNFNQQSVKNDDAMADAIAARDEAYTLVDPAKITNNADQVSYIETYLDNIDDKNSVIAKLEEKIEAEEKNFKKECDEIKDQIKAREAVIKSITKKS